MNKFIRYVVILPLIGAMLLPGISSAQSTSQLQAQINALLAQLQTLQQQLAAAQGSTTAAWCHTFNTNLGVGSTGGEVVALQTALQKENIMETGADNGIYDETIASFVTAFQEKYSKDILSPAGLNNGTGYVGSGTRAKLNVSYGCGTNQSAPTTPISTPTTVNPYVSSAQVTPGGLILSGTFGASNNQVWIDSAVPKITYQSTSEIIVSLAGVSVGTHLVSVGYAGLGSIPVSFTVTSATALTPTPTQPSPTPSPTAPTSQSTSTSPSSSYTPPPINPYVYRTQVSGGNLTFFGSFGPSDNQVRIDGVVVPVLSEGGFQVVVSSVGLSAGTHLVRVGYAGLGSIPFSFTVSASLTGVQGYNSATGVYTNGSVTAGKYLVLYGNFGSLGNAVTIDGSPVPASAVTYQSAGQINVSLAGFGTAMNVSGSSHTVSITTPSGSTNALPFTVAGSSVQ